MVAYARNLDGTPYDGFISFLQSLTEAGSKKSLCRNSFRYHRYLSYVFLRILLTRIFCARALTQGAERGVKGALSINY